MSSGSKLLVTPTAIHDVFVIEPKVFGDERGWFTESFNAEDFAIATGLDVQFVQDNHSFSRQWSWAGARSGKLHIENTTNGEVVYDDTRVTASWPVGALNPGSYRISLRRITANEDPWVTVGFFVGR